jgi:hypothetical protein
MTAKIRGNLKAWFQTGGKPSGQDFAHLIDSALNLREGDAQSLSGKLTVSCVSGTTVTAEDVYVNSPDDQCSAASTNGIPVYGYFYMEQAQSQYQCYKTANGKSTTAWEPTYFSCEAGMGTCANNFAHAEGFTWTNRGSKRFRVLTSGKLKYTGDMTAQVEFNLSFEYQPLYNDLGLSSWGRASYPAFFSAGIVVNSAAANEDMQHQFVNATAKWIGNEKFNFALTFMETTACWQYMRTREECTFISKLRPGVVFQPFVNHMGSNYPRRCRYGSFRWRGIIIGKDCA